MFLKTDYLQSFHDLMNMSGGGIFRVIFLYTEKNALIAI